MLLDFNLTFGWSSLLKWIALACLSLFYRVLVELWLFMYRHGIKKTYWCQKPLISVGNITVGGTGKTPMIAWFLSFCEKRNLTAAVLTRGYKSDGNNRLKILDGKTASQGNSKQFGDEPWLLFKRHPQALFYIASDRMASARLAAAKADLLLLDDGMQQLRIERSLNIVLIDSLSGIGNGQMLPLGPLREPLTGLSRADIVIYSRTNLVSPENVRQKIAPFLKPGIQSYCAEFLPEAIVSSSETKTLTIRELTQKKCLLFSGIGNPQSFTLTVKQFASTVVGHLIFEDHCHYNGKD
jgi:tetraacyldisaccharide 4'-kinase